jgi:hypothetical protein
VRLVNVGMWGAGEERWVSTHVCVRAHTRSHRDTYNRHAQRESGREREGERLLSWRTLGHALVFVPENYGEGPIDGRCAGMADGGLH